MRSFGYEVSVISPVGSNYDTESHVVLEGVNIYRYRLRADTEGVAAFVSEYLTSFFKTLWLAIRIFSRKRFHAIHTANPPDIFFAVAIPFKVLFRVKFIYDQHDLCPELFRQKFGRSHRTLLKLQFFLERLTYRTADAVIATNQSIKEIALNRGRVSEEDIFIVRNGPEDGFPSGAGVFNAGKGFRFICSYVGVMGVQDGVDYILKAAAVIVHSRGRHDVCFVIVGGGEKLGELKKMAVDLQLDDFVQFTGRISDADLKAVLKSSDVCLAPDPENDFNTWHTMNKIMDYMIFGKPIVSFNLKESRISADEAAVYVANNDIDGFAAAVLSLLDDPLRRAKMGEIGKQRVRSLTWQHSVGVLEEAYRHVLGVKE